MIFQSKPDIIGAHSLLAVSLYFWANVCWKTRKVASFVVLCFLEFTMAKRPDFQKTLNEERKINKDLSKDVMKQIFVHIVFFLSLGLSAQSLEVQDAPDYIQFDPQSSFYETGLTIYNSSDSAIAVVAERVDNQVTGPQYNFFCWDVCYGATVDRSIGAIQIRSGKSTDAFTLTFHPEGDASPVQVTMRFYNRATPTDYVEHTFHFGTSATPIGGEIAPTQQLSQPYPNPARSISKLDYALPPTAKSAHLALYNLIGKQVGSFPLSASKDHIVLPVQQYPNGMYMVSMVIDGKAVATRRLVVVK